MSAAFPIDAAPFVGGHFVLDAIAVDRRADHEHVFGVLGPKPLLAPVRPAVFGADMILIEFGVDAHRAKRVRQVRARGPNARENRGCS